jgi:hypothetical protein
MPQLIEYIHEKPVDFITTLGDIVRDGDSMKPEDLVKDISWMIDNWLKEHKVREELEKLFPGEEIHTLDIVE